MLLLDPLIKVKVLLNPVTEILEAILEYHPEVSPFHNNPFAVLTSKVTETY